MTILAVDGFSQRLDSLSRLLRRAFPEDSVIAQRDPLAAGKYSYNNPVDILFAAFELPRLDGLKLAEFVRHANPNAFLFLIADPEKDPEEGLWEGELDGLLRYPVTESLLRDALYNARHATNKDEAETAHGA